MNPAQVLIADLVALLLIGTLAGMACRRRLPDCWPFAALLLLTCTTNRLVVWWPEVFYTRPFWIRKELAFLALQAMVVLDLCGTALRSWRRARRVGIAAVLSVVVATGMIMLGTDAHNFQEQTGVLIARANVGAAWAFAALVGVVWWYRLPMSPFHHQIALGSALHLSAYGALLSLVGWAGWSFHPYLRALDPAVYAATVGVWLFAAWRPDAVHAPYPAGSPVRQ